MRGGARWGFAWSECSGNMRVQSQRSSAQRMEALRIPLWMSFAAELFTGFADPSA